MTLPTMMLGTHTLAIMAGLIMVQLLLVAGAGEAVGAAGAGAMEDSMAVDSTVDLEEAGSTGEAAFTEALAGDPMAVAATVVVAGTDKL